MRIDHIALWTDDLDRCARFYAEHFGAEVGPLYRNPAKGFASRFLSFAGGARIEGLTPITAVGVAVTDVAWNDELKIFGIGHDVATGIPGIYEFQCDGSLWRAIGISGLPNEPQTITVAGGQDAAVSVGDSVWKQSAGTWEPLNSSDEAQGTAPIYVR